MRTVDAVYRIAGGVCTLPLAFAAVNRLPGALPAPFSTHLSLQMRRPSSYSLAVAVLALSGCYRYVPGTAADQAAGAEVRLELTPEGSQRLSSVIGADILSLTGRILEAGEGELSMSVGRSLRRSGTEQSWTGERVSIPRDAIARTDRRTLDRKRTTLASVLAVLGAGLIGAILNSVSTQGNPGGGSTPPPPPA